MTNGMPCACARRAPRKVALVAPQPHGIQSRVLGCNSVDLDVVTDVERLVRGCPEQPAGVVKRPGVWLAETEGVSGRDDGEDTLETGDLELALRVCLLY